ncbi:MAG: SHOCT domain-containing protein [Candidatus Omnitrophica bacterium]|nr:SHOCT domain-containing protein [Candidatus Omnitrophota bacterium]
MKKFAILCCFFLVGCANTGITQLSSDTYAITGSNFQGIFTNVAALKAKTIQEANEFAAAQGKVAVIQSYKLHRPLVGSFTRVKYQFKLVDKKDAEKARAEAEGVSRNDSLARGETAKASDLYEELLKLEELRKKNLLTEEEFQNQKKRLLEAQK